MYLLVHVFISLCVYSIALSDPETGEYILNGNFIVSPQRKILRYAGVNIEYSGSNSIVEQINSSIPLNKELVVEVSDRSSGCCVSVHHTEVIGRIFQMGSNR